jgi:hypothetical protein
MLLSRAKPAPSTTNNAKEKPKKVKPELEDLVRERDYVGAITLLDVTNFKTF